MISQGRLRDVGMCHQPANVVGGAQDSKAAKTAQLMLLAARVQCNCFKVDEAKLEEVMMPVVGELTRAHGRN